MRIAGLVSFVAVVGLVSCDPGRPVVVPQPSVNSALKGSIPGAIFTTTPGGTIVDYVTPSPSPQGGVPPTATPVPPASDQPPSLYRGSQQHLGGAGNYRQ